MAADVRKISEQANISQTLFRGDDQSRDFSIVRVVVGR
jgi:hypothetical protein